MVALICVLSLTSALFAVALASDEITELPGLSYDIVFKHYSGYVQASNTRFHHYWLVESQGDPATDPLIFWFNGGPGCSSLFGLLGENGPYLLDWDNKTLNDNPYSWNKFASVVYVEAPAGVGFSYFTEEDDQNFDDETTASDNYEAFKNFFSLYPKFRNHSVFLTGESYGGIYLPTLAELIVEGQHEFPINLAGVGIGNGFVDREIGERTSAEFFYAHGFIDERKWSDFTACCNGSSNLLQCDIDRFDSECNATYHSMYDAANNASFNAYDIYRNCDRYKGDASCTPDLVAYFDNDNVRKALHIPEFVQKWNECGGSLPGYNKTVHSVFNQTKNVLESGVRVLLYYGDTDTMCNFLMGQQFAASLGYKETSPKEPWTLNNALGGFKTVYDGGLTYITVRGVGHMVPQWAPRRAQYFIRQFVKNEPI